MDIRPDYIHRVPVTSESRRYRGGTDIDHYLWEGTSQQIADQVAAAVKSYLDNGNSTRIELTPIAPWNITKLGDR